MKQVSINEDVLELSGDGPRLLGMRCRDCGNHVFPRQKGCPKCAGTDLEGVTLGTRGTLWAWTIQGFPPKAPPYLGETDPKKFKPFGIGYIELPAQTRVEARLTESDPARLIEGMEMELTIEPIATDEDGNEIVTYAFKPIEEGARQ